jgi:hypothetical protein
MKKILLIALVATICFARMPTRQDPDDADFSGRQPLAPQLDRVLVGPVGDIRAILGPQGKNISVCGNGDAIAIMLGDPTTSTTNYLEAKLAYSLDDGASWVDYGPFSPEVRRLYPHVDGSPDFDVNPGEVYFTWQESPDGYATGDIKVMIEENVPSAPSFSTPVSLPGASGSAMTPWYGNHAVNPDDPYDLVAIAFSYLANGNESIYSWTSNDGGYSWSDSQFVCSAIDPRSGTNGAGHVRRGTGGYALITFHDTITYGGTPITFPKYVESTDGGATWSSKYALPIPLYGLNSSFWWTELDCEVINNEPWIIHNDIQAVDDSLGHWLAHGTGSPGSWTWDFENLDDYTFETTIGDTTYYFGPGQYPSISYDPVSGIILASCKSNYIKVHLPSDTVWTGPHIGGIYSTDNGATWQVTQPLSTPNTGTIPWADWNATEVAHRLVNDNGTVYSYGAWVNEPELNIYFERGAIAPWPPVGVAEYQNEMISYGFSVTPNISRDHCQAAFTMLQAGSVTLTLYDATGRLIENIFAGNLEQGNQSFDINTARLVNGTYFAVLETDRGADSRKLIKLY